MRATIFSRRELRVLTEGMNSVPSGRYMSNEVKLVAYQSIRRHFRLRYYISRSIVQLQRSWSDLRRRQPQLLDDLRQEIRRIRARWERRQRHRAVREAEEEAEEDQLQQVAVQVEDEAEACPETEGDEQGEGQEKAQEDFQPAAQSSTSTSGAAECSTEEPEPDTEDHQDQEAERQLLVPQVVEALGDTHMEEADSWPPPPPTLSQIRAEIAGYWAKIKNLQKEQEQCFEELELKMDYWSTLYD
ncbi:uncharacterized protein LOC142101840 [Mixophyes fleayi]|uniref:uncharacterized protein LOC142101840 n=1 Tax=Mixophyes fleayi TaxID=3061075 RepID=UPI003F4D7D21